MSRLLLHRPRALGFKGYICDPAAYYHDNPISLTCIGRAGEYRRLDVIKIYCLLGDDYLDERIETLVKNFNLDQLPKLSISMLFAFEDSLFTVLLRTIEYGHLHNMLFIKQNTAKYRKILFKSKEELLNEYISPLLSRFIANEFAKFNKKDRLWLRKFCRKYKINLSE